MVVRHPKYRVSLGRLAPRSDASAHKSAAPARGRLYPSGGRRFRKEEGEEGRELDME